MARAWIYRIAPLLALGAACSADDPGGSGAPAILGVPAWSGGGTSSAPAGNGAPVANGATSGNPSLPSTEPLTPVGVGTNGNAGIGNGGSVGTNDANGNGAGAGAGGTSGAGGNPASMAGGSGGAPSTDPVTPSGSPSAGCNPSAGIPQNLNVLASIMSFPDGYDGGTPVPLLFAFHGAGRTNEDMRNVDSRSNGSVLEQNYVVAYMKSQGNAWDLGTDYPRFNQALDQVLAAVCIDTGAIFAMGHSSGAQFIAQMLGDTRARERRFAGVAPVSSSRFGNPAWEPVPTLLIHGLMDTQRPNDRSGAIDITQYTESNQCGTGTQPLAVPGCGSLAGNVPVNPGCIQYDGCSAVTWFCNHDDPNYLENGTTPSNHGWPCFANREIFEFFEALR